MTIVILLIAVSSITLGAFGALWAQDYWRQRTAPRELKPILDMPLTAPEVNRPREM